MSTAPSWPFPLFVPLNLSRTHYGGYVGCAGSPNSYAFSAFFHSSSDLSQSTLSCSPELTDLLGSNGLSLLQQRKENSSSLLLFLVELYAIIESCEKEKNLKKKVDGPGKGVIQAVASAEVCARLLKELDGLWHQLGRIHPSLTSLQLFFNDSAGRKHEIEVIFPDLYPLAPPTCNMDTPGPIELEWDDTCSLKDMLHQCQVHSEQYIGLWKQLDDIDQHTWVLEPDKPSYSITKRRIALENHCSVLIDIDVSAPCRMPHCKFLGSDNRISLLRSKIHSNYHKWDDKGKVRENLENILEVCFPERPLNEEENDLECAICYSYKMENDIPDQVCDNVKCRKTFHHLCLYEWLRAASSRNSFDTFFGSCPNCFEDISVKAIR